MNKKLFLLITNILFFSNLLFSSVVINELMINPVNPLGNQFSEYIELYNTSNEDINLENWFLSNEEQSITFPDITINANSYFTLGMTNNQGLNQGMTFDYEWGVGDDFLNNGNDLIRLYDFDNNLIYTVEYHDLSWPVVEGASMELNNPLNNSNTYLVWNPGTVLYDGVNLGSPGVQNSNYTGVPELSYNDLSFGVTQFGTPTTLPLTLESAGGIPVTIYNISESESSLFSYDLPELPLVLNPGETINIDITFLADSPDTPYSTTITFETSSLPSNTFDISVSASSGTPQIYLYDDISFNVTEAMESSISSVTIGNSGTYTLNLLSASLTSDNSSNHFEILTFFPVTVPPGENFQIEIQFNPQESNSYDMTLSIEHDDIYYQDNSYYEYNFTALSVSPSISLDTDSIIFPTIHEGEQTTYTLLVSNTGTGDLIVSDVTFDNDVFSAENTSFTVNEGQTYSLDVTFTPLSMGTITGTMTIVSNGHNTNLNTVSLTGEVVSGTLVLVPTDFALIQDAISYAEEGDTVLVSPGTYDQTFTFQGKSLTVLGQEGSENTFLGLPDNQNLILEDSFDYNCTLNTSYRSCGYWSYYEENSYSEAYAEFSTSDEGRVFLRGHSNRDNFLYSPGFNHHDYETIKVTINSYYNRVGNTSNQAFLKIRSFQSPSGSFGSNFITLNCYNDICEQTAFINSESYHDWEMMQLQIVNNSSNGNPLLYIYSISIEGIVEDETRELYESKDIVSFESGEGEESILKGFTIQPGEFPSLSTRGIKISNSSSPIIDDIHFSSSIYENFIQEYNIWNAVTDRYLGSAIYITGNSNPIINNTIIDSSLILAFSDVDAHDFESSGPLYIENSNPTFNNLSILNSGQTENVNGEFKGGAAYIKNSHATFNSSIFSNNVSYNSSNAEGGAFYIQNGDDYSVTFNNCTFENNSTDSNGGAIYTTNSLLNINESVFNNNSAYNGGAIYSTSSELNIDNSSISSNLSNEYGGGLYLSSTTSYLNNVTINQNTTNELGGGIYQTSGSNYIYDSFVNDNAARYGGGIYLSGQYTDIQMYDTEIRRNSAVKGGGIFENSIENMITERLLIADNSVSEKGGGMYFTNYDPVFTNFTLVNNTATFLGSGLFCESNVYPVFLNSIIWGNQSADGAHVYLSSGSEIILNYNNIQSGAAGIVGFDDIIYNDNISTEPYFTDSENEDYTLLVTSPCIDAGNPNSEYDADGTLADMGYIFFDQITNNPGCTDEGSQNYDPDANVNLGCIYGPGFISIYDTPEDQGGYVFLNWNANTLDVLPNTDILNYSVWRHIPDERGWEHLGDVPASYEASYSFTAPTINTTAVDGDTLYTTYKIKAHTLEQNLFYESAEGLGYSIDNIVPSTPEGLLGNYTEEGIVISWDESTDLDLSYYTLYRENEYVGTSSTNSYLDSEILQPPINYSIIAYDINNNVSEYSQTYMYTSDVLGDITQDYIVNVLDIIVLVNIIFDTYMGGETPEDYILESSDINEDGLINILDVVGIVNLIMNIAN